jgi:hypothetical protein
MTAGTIMAHGRRTRVHKAQGLWSFVAAWVAIAVYFLLKHAFMDWAGLDKGSAQAAALALGAGLVLVVVVGALAWTTAVHRRRPPQ